MHDVKELMREAQHSTIAFFSWMGKLKKDDAKWGPYYLQWIEAAQLALDGWDASGEERDKITLRLVDDLGKLATVPMRGMLDALKAYADAKKVKLPKLDSDGITDVLEFKKAAMKDIDKLIVLLDVGANK